MNHYLDYSYGYWPLVIGNVLFFSFLAFSLYKPKTSLDWKSMGALGSFFVALFAEMYGFPFTIYLLTTWLGQRYPVIDPFSHNNGHLIRVFFGESRLISFIVHPGTDILLIASLVIIGAGWKKIHGSRGGLVMDGVYKYIRHPQYTGFILMIFAFLIQWPTIITLIMAPFLVLLYTHLAKKEEQKMLILFGEKYRTYMKTTRRFIPAFPQF